MQVKTSGDGKIAFVFNKHDLLAIKNGKILDAQLVSGDQKLHCAFIRDHVYEQEVRRFQKETQQAAANALRNSLVPADAGSTEPPKEPTESKEIATNP